MINFGSFFSTMITPWTLQHYGPGIAFGIPGILMAIATFIFWLGRNEFVHIPPTGKQEHGTGRVLLSAIKNFGQRGNEGVLGGALKDHPKKQLRLLLMLVRSSSQLLFFGPYLISTVPLGFFKQKKWFLM